MKVRLLTGRPATSPRGGSSARPKAEPAAEVTKPRFVWIPRNEPDTPLACGCKIPWPIVTLIGSARESSGRHVMCDLHGWQPRITKAEIDKAKRRMKQWHDTHTEQQSFPDEPPF